MAEEKYKENAGLLELLRKEYEQIQSKIDKIGEFKFKVKGWALTILSGFGIGIFTYEIPWYAVFIVLLIVAIFHYLEREQHEYQARLESRVSDLEYVIQRFTLNKEEKEKKKEILDNKAIERIGYSPRFGSIIGAKGKHSKSSFFNPIAKENRLYFILYILTLVLFSIVYQIDRGNKKSNQQNQNVEIHYNRNQEPILNKHMKKKSPIENVEEEMYELVSQIDFGDITDIDLYWESLATSLMKLKIENWEKPRNKKTKVSEILKSMTFTDTSKIVKTTIEMEKLSKSGSNPSEENLEELQSLAIVFEEEFEAFLKTLPDNE